MEKITGDELVTATVKPGFVYGDGSYEESSIKGGLTIRQHFAAMVMQGLAAKYNLNKPEDQQIISQMSVELADSLITELNK